MGDEPKWQNGVPSVANPMLLEPQIIGENAELHCLISQDIHFARVKLPDAAGEVIAAFVNTFDDRHVTVAFAETADAAADKLMNMLDRDPMSWDQALGEIGYVPEIVFPGLMGNKKKQESL